MKETLVLDIEPKPQSRPKATIKGRHAGVYEKKDMTAWRSRCTALVRSTYHGHYFTKAIKVTTTFYMKAPKEIAKVPGARSKEETKRRYADFMAEKLYVPKKPDLDNLEKSVYDSISNAKSVWTDDSIIVEHTTRKIYSPTPRITLEIEEVEVNE